MLGNDRMGLVGRKESSLCHKLWFSNPDILQPRPFIFETLDSLGTKNLSLKDPKFTNQVTKL